MYKLRFISLLFFALFVSSLSYAQKDKKKPSTDVEIIDFGDESGSQKEQKVYKGLIIKTSPISFVFGTQPVELENEITDLLSLQVGLGVTFEPLWAEYDEFVAELVDASDGYCESRMWTYDECDYYNDYTIRTGKVGLLASASSRLFFDSDGYEGMYIAPFLRFSQQKFEVEKVREGYAFLERTPDDTQSESVTNFDILVHYGSQALYPKLSMEWFIGAGVRLRNNTRQDIGYDGLNLLRNGERNFKDKRFRFEAGIRIGLQL